MYSGFYVSREVFPCERNGSRSQARSGSDMVYWSREFSVDAISLEFAWLDEFFQGRAAFIGWKRARAVT